VQGVKPRVVTTKKMLPYGLVTVSVLRAVAIDPRLHALRIVAAVTPVVTAVAAPAMDH
jgi:hypothetical protein